MLSAAKRLIAVSVSRENELMGVMGISKGNYRQPRIVSESPTRVADQPPALAGDASQPREITIR